MIDLDLPLSDIESWTGDNQISIFKSYTGSTLRVI